MTDQTTTPNRFPAGTFAPAPSPAPLTAMLAAQTRMELTLLLRNGEQLLLTMFIPITLLIGLSILPIDTGSGDTPAARATTFVPAILAVAIMSTAFTGQAIAVGFDRRYGALKRLGATPIPRWGIIAGKSSAVAIVVALQAVIIGGIGAAFGWRPSVGGLALGAVVIVLGTVAFAALGLLLGGTMKAEVVLALGNLIWFVLLGVSSLVVFDEHVPAAVHWAARCTPSGALTESLTQALAGSVDLFGIGVLAAWAVVGGALAVRWFRFE
ncbi:ABC transporter permease [Gordonia malaquae]|jgi:ABC-2 type transport system permease protein|uniref:Putative ABC transporter permease protein n=1 Tax=Gordonia malaquae NBRC 108250 TaxID=1223542 RepID=M3UVB0_GORML|nr:ABC transporter permease [Gordonia malaquae]GAC79457.1 putative ABC transporter permease protein [Gordonia malaquae NBRC 108250]SED25483.1 ABC-2 type transport system permease protein [Gordonia malaquae]